MKNNFSKNLRRWREEEGITQKQLGERLGVTQRKISYLESGKVEPDMDTLIRISQVLETTIDALLKDD